VTKECELMRIDEREFTRAAERIAQDLTATLGWDTARAQAHARDALGDRLSYAPTVRAWADLDQTIQREVLEVAVVEAVEDLQQQLHDTFVDTSWPPCPRHPNHPLWLLEAQGGGSVWCCPRDEAEIAPLGMLPGSAHPPGWDP
jgi:hypothetical protein